MDGNTCILELGKLGISEDQADASSRCVFNCARSSVGMASDVRSSIFLTIPQIIQHGNDAPPLK